MVNLFLGILITWRVSSLLVYERGPYDVFGKIRDIVGIRYNEQSQAIATNEISRLFECVFCMSIWLGWGVALTMGRQDWFARGLAYSAGAIVIDITIGRAGGRVS